MTDEPDNGQVATTGYTSVQKVEAFAEHMAEQAGGDVVATAAKALLPEMMRRIPQAPDALDLQLAAYAQLCLGMRSDSADELYLAGPDGQRYELPDPPAE